MIQLDIDYKKEHYASEQFKWFINFIKLKLNSMISKINN